MDYQIIISLLTLIVLQVVLGIDNIIFISILAGKLPPEQKKKQETWVATMMRIGLLGGLSLII
jgi:predicted tellurium resistance membrane protein TerC